MLIFIYNNIFIVLWIRQLKPMLICEGINMLQRQKMRKELNNNVIPILIQQGFYGKFPHYKRKIDDRIELLVFMTNKYGGAFNIEISTIFPNYEKELSNYYTQEFQSIDEVTVYSTNKRYRLEGMFDGWFYYTDVYKSKLPLTKFRTFDCYESISEQKSKSFIPEEKQVLVQKADDSLYSTIAVEVNRQLKNAFEWWEKCNTPKKMKKCK